MKKIPLKARGNVWWLVRTTPTRFRSVEPKAQIWVSMNTHVYAEAASKAEKVWAELVKGWELKLAGRSDDAVVRFDAARQIAASKGFRYAQVDEVASLPIEDIVARVMAVSFNSAGVPDAAETKALMGVEPEPEITVSRAMEMYLEIKLVTDHIDDNKDQIRIWRNPVKLSCREFIEVVGDKALSKITRNDMRAYRDMLLDRVSEGEIKPITVNKHLMHLNKVFNFINDETEMDLRIPNKNLNVPKSYEKDAQRPTFSEEWIKTKLLAPGALDDLHPEARAIFRVIVNTGCRPSEVVNLTSNTIHLNSNVPYISIEPEGRKTKSRSSVRKIPLTGISLEAMRAFPEGFPSFRNGPKNTRIINEYLTDKGLRETPEHTLYGLRHAFEDRMIRAGFDNRIRVDLFGHSLKRERYGEGGGLPYVYELLQKIAY